MAFTGSSGANPNPSERIIPRPARSKNGCLTCRRRKVRCDEHRPRCSHCERLNLQCMWRPAYAPTQWKFVGADPNRLAIASDGNSDGFSPGPFAQTPKPDARGVLPEHAWLQSPGGVDQMFDYASFMWNAGPEVMGSSAGSEQHRQSLGSGADWAWPEMDNQSLPMEPDGASNLPTSPEKRPSERPSDFAIPNSHASRNTTQANTSTSVQDHDLLNYFVRTVVPPILAEVETQKRWATMRQMLISMSNASAMVRCAILAFSSLLYFRREAPWMACPQTHYEMAMEELLASGDIESVVAHTGLREHLLATLFFLSYVDILEGRLANAHEHLKRAYSIFQQGNKRGFRPVEIRLLSWIRLIDARAVSAGGEGLFLSEKSEALIVQPSPASVDETADTDANAGDSTTSGIEEVKEWDIEDVLFQVLYQPGIIFFQKVESFMGRISMIDPWHRSRGTVEDETEVMQIASQIMKDLSQLYDDRPTLMDHAVEGRLTAPHVSASLATSITRAFRTYLSNYHASKIHLHRVAYKHLPLSREAKEALNQTRRLTKLLVDALEPEAALPVSQLWPLLMLGSEEEDPAEREWIKQQIRRMETVATNASITAHVLEEVQARQDASKARVDIRSVMHAIFDSCFAIM